MTFLQFSKLSTKLTFLALLVFSTTPPSYATEKCGNFLILSSESATTVTLRVSLSSCEELANAAELSFTLPPHLSFHSENLLLGNLYKLPSENRDGVVTLRYVSLEELSGVTDIVDIHFEKVADGNSLPQLLPDSLILLSDGKGTNIFSMK